MTRHTLDSDNDVAADLRELRRLLPAATVRPEAWRAFGRIEKALGSGIYALPASPAPLDRERLRSALLSSFDDNEGFEWQTPGTLNEFANAIADAYEAKP